MVDLTDISWDGVWIGGIAFILAFIIGIVIWSILLRFGSRAFSKGGLYFIPEIMRSLTPSIAVGVFLLSIYAGLSIIRSDVLTNPLFKIWNILLIFVIVNIIAKMILSMIDIRYRKARIAEIATLYRSLPMLKSAVSILIYSLAFILSIQVLDTEAGFVVAILVALLGLFFFTVFHSQIKSIAAGFQLTNYYVEEGDLIEIDGNRGFVERIHARSTLLRTIDGKMIVVPNYVFFKRLILLHKTDMNEISIYTKIKGTDIDKISSKLHTISSKLTMDLKDIPNESKPKIFVNGVKNGITEFVIRIKLVRGADVQNILHLLNTNILKEFKGNVESIEI
ncbi:MAG: mechanosensitive ion channel domain-containing protein [Candidatus Micrarchaeota archaeon]